MIVKPISQRNVGLSDYTKNNFLDTLWSTCKHVDVGCLCLSLCFTYICC